MEMRKHEFGDAPLLPGLDVSLRQQAPSTPTTTPDSRLPDRLAFTHVRRACELAIHHGDYQLAWRGVAVAHAPVSRSTLAQYAPRTGIACQQAVRVSSRQAAHARPSP